jgi:hypothetical protein
MKIISCPIAGKSLIVQFEPGAADSLEEHATRRPDAASHGLLFGSLSGNDPKWLHVQHIQPVFGFGESSGPVPVGRATAMITLGYYMIRSDGENLDQADRDFLADSLPASARVAMVITGKPDRRMLAQFYLRDGKGAFGPTPDHRQVLLAQETAPSEPEETETGPNVRLWLGRIGAAVGLAVAILIMAIAWNSRPRLAEPVHRPVQTTARRAAAATTAYPSHASPSSAYAGLTDPAPGRHEPVAHLPLPGFALPVQSVRQIKDPPEVAVFYPEPGNTSAPPAATDARHAVLVHPIINQENPR